MSETRVKKYKDYRNSLTREDIKIDTSFITTQRENTVDEILENHKDETPSSTLSISYDKIIEATKVDEEKDKINKTIRQKYILRILGATFLCSAVIITIVVLAIFLF